MQTFIKSSYIKCDIKTLFDFHIDTKNLKHITPNDIKVELLTKNYQPKHTKILDIKSTKYFIPMYWKVKIQTIDEPNLLVDIALSSPFKFWEHKHIFIEHKDRCELKDVITYELPFGVFGRFFNLFIAKDLEKMFDFRHKATKEILEKGLK